MLAPRTCAARAGGGYDFSGASPHGSEYCSETTDHCAVSQSISRRRHLCRCRPGTTGSDILSRRMPATAPPPLPRRKRAGSPFATARPSNSVGRAGPWVHQPVAEKHTARLTPCLAVHLAVDTFQASYLCSLLPNEWEVSPTFLYWRKAVRSQY